MERNKRVSRAKSDPRAKEDHTLEGELGSEQGRTGAGHFLHRRLRAPIQLLVRDILHPDARLQIPIRRPPTIPAEPARLVVVRNPRHDHHARRPALHPVAAVRPAAVDGLLRCGLPELHGGERRRRPSRRGEVGLEEVDDGDGPPLRDQGVVGVAAVLAEVEDEAAGEDVREHGPV